MHFAVTDLDAEQPGVVGRSDEAVSESKTILIARVDFKCFMVKEPNTLLQSFNDSNRKLRQDQWFRAMPASKRPP